jgi:hypothetical protein
MCPRTEDASLERCVPWNCVPSFRYSKPSREYDIFLEISYFAKLFKGYWVTIPSPQAAWWTAALCSAAPGTAARPAWSARRGTAASAPSQALDSAAMMVKGQPGRLVDRRPSFRHPWDRRPPCLVARQGRPPPPLPRR